MILTEVLGLPDILRDRSLNTGRGGGVYKREREGHKNVLAMLKRGEGVRKKCLIQWEVACTTGLSLSLGGGGGGGVEGQHRQTRVFPIL